MNMTLVSALGVAIVSAAMVCAPLRAQPAEQGTTKSAEAGTTKSPAPRPIAPITEAHAGPKGFNIVLVLGDMVAVAKEDNVPAAARKALTDLKDFLPYKSYRLLDTQFTACCGAVNLRSRLRGPDDQDYELDLSPRPVLANKWSVRFALREPGGGPGAGDYTGALREKEAVLLAAERLETARKLADLRQKLDEPHPDVLQLKAQIQELERRSNTLGVAEANRKNSAAALASREFGRAVIDTSFTMDVGETVVVGTSRLKGDKALIALLTAIPPRK